MINKKAVLAFTIAASLAASPFMVSAKAYDTKLISANPMNSITVNKIAFEVVDPSTAPDALRSRLDECKKQKGFIYYEDTATGYIYIAIFTGEKRTGGYGVEVLSVEDNEGKTNISIKEISPSPDAIVTQALTYPYIIIKAKSITPNIFVKTEKGDAYSLISCGKNAPIKIGTSSVSGKLVKVEYKGDICYVSIKKSNGEISYYYVSKKSPTAASLKKLKSGTNVKLVYALGTPVKYNTKVSAMPLNSFQIIK